MQTNKKTAPNVQNHNKKPEKNPTDLKGWLKKESDIKPIVDKCGSIKEAEEQVFKFMKDKGLGSDEKSSSVIQELWSLKQLLEKFDSSLPDLNLPEVKKIQYENEDYFSTKNPDGTKAVCDFILHHGNKEFSIVEVVTSPSIIQEQYDNFIDCENGTYLQEKNCKKNEDICVFCYLVRELGVSRRELNQLKDRLVISDNDELQENKPRKSKQNQEQMLKYYEMQLRFLAHFVKGIKKEQQSNLISFADIDIVLYVHVLKKISKFAIQLLEKMNKIGDYKREIEYFEQIVDRFKTNLNNINLRDGIEHQELIENCISRIVRDTKLSDDQTKILLDSGVDNFHIVTRSTQIYYRIIKDNLLVLLYKGLEDYMYIENVTIADEHEKSLTRDLFRQIDNKLKKGYELKKEIKDKCHKKILLVQNCRAYHDVPENNIEDYIQKEIINEINNAAGLYKKFLSDIIIHLKTGEFVHIYKNADNIWILADYDARRVEMQEFVSEINVTNLDKLIELTKNMEMVEMICNSQHDDIKKKMLQKCFGIRETAETYCEWDITLNDLSHNTINSIVELLKIVHQDKYFLDHFIEMDSRMWKTNERITESLIQCCKSHNILKLISDIRRFPDNSKKASHDDIGPFFNTDQSLQDLIICQYLLFLQRFQLYLKNANYDQNYVVVKNLITETQNTLHKWIIKAPKDKMELTPI